MGVALYSPALRSATVYRQARPWPSPSVSYDYTADFSDEVEDTNTDYRYIAGQIFSLTLVRSR